MNKRPALDLTVKFSDCDPFGHLYNVRYLDYMLDAREQHVVNEYPLLRAAMTARDKNWVIVATDIRYVRPAKFGDFLRIESSIFQVDRYGVSLEVAMLDASSGVLKAIQWSRLRYVDLARGAITSHSPEIQGFLESVELDYKAADLEERIGNIQARCQERAQAVNPTWRRVRSE